MSVLYGTLEILDYLNRNCFLVLLWCVVLGPEELGMLMKLARSLQSYNNYNFVH